MSLIVKTSLPLLLNIALVFADSGDDNGGLDGGDDSGANTKAKTEEKTEEKTQEKTQENTTAQTTGTTVATTANTENTQTQNTGTDTTGTGVTYNQWGFTGSQSKWQEVTTGATSGSESTSGSSILFSLKNKTSSAARIRTFHHEGNWKHGAFLGAVMAVTIGLHCM